MPERKFGPNKFERLNQASQAKEAQVTNEVKVFQNRLITPEVDYELNPKGSRFLSLLSPHGRRLAMQAAAPLLTIAALVSSCEVKEPPKESEPTQVQTQEPSKETQVSTEHFVDNLPRTLVEVCELYVSSTYLDPQEEEVERKLGNTLIGVYLDANSNNPDARALYLAGLGFMLSFESADDLELVQSSFRLAVQRGLPKPQEELAIGIIESIDKLTEATDIENESVILVDLTFDIVDDLKANVCP